jgi:hypothetical protein
MGKADIPTSPDVPDFDSSDDSEAFVFDTTVLPSLAGSGGGGSIYTRPSVLSAHTATSAADDSAQSAPDAGIMQVLSMGGGRSGSQIYNIYLII